MPRRLSGYQPRVVGRNRITRLEPAVSLRKERIKRQKSMIASFGIEMVPPFLRVLDNKRRFLLGKIWRTIEIVLTAYD